MKEILNTKNVFAIQTKLKFKEVFKINTQTIAQFDVLDAEMLVGVEGGIKVAPGVYCRDVNGRAKCSADYKELWRYTGQVVVNGWINYGPWAPRPGFGVIIP